MPEISFRSVFLFSAVLRAFLIFYGEWQDAHMEVRYTDVDYLVFSDAARLMASGNSPYERSTYRYSPLVAFLLIPNSLLHQSWGKFLFSASDLLVGLLIHRILKLRGVPEKLSVYCTMVWLFNPFTFTIGTRGNCEPVVCSIILWILVCLINDHILQASFWYGLVVHLRIYPIIYAVPIMLLLDPRHYLPGNCKPALVQWSSQTSQSSRVPSYSEITYPLLILNFLKSIFTWRRIAFAVVSASTFFLFTGISFYLYRWDFLNEALLYHLTRTDPRHNFSIYFYHIYLNYAHEFSVLEKLVSFLPQFMVQLALISRFSLDLPFCLFLQTVAFVAFNKVITAQYFVWFFCLLPLILPWSHSKLNRKGVAGVALWVGAQTHWLTWAYLLEFRGKNVLFQLWLASLVFLAANVYVVVNVIQSHAYTPLFQRLENTHSNKAVKDE